MAVFAPAQVGFNAPGVSCAPLQAGKDMSRLRLSGRGYFRSRLRDNARQAHDGRLVYNMSSNLELRLWPRPLKSSTATLKFSAGRRCLWELVFLSKRSSIT